MQAYLLIHSTSFNYLPIKKRAANSRLHATQAARGHRAARRVLQLIIREGLFNFLLRCRDYWWLTRLLGCFK